MKGSCNSRKVPIVLSMHPQLFRVAPRPWQVMALLAYLKQHKGIAGPHLIIVPNAVIVNWKSELQQWLPGLRCVW